MGEPSAALRLRYGVYDATESFRSVAQHSCVCWNDMGLIATTGPAGEPLSEAYAELFSAAPRLAAAIAEEIVQLRSWAAASVAGGWSTHQVDPMRKRADQLEQALWSLRTVMQTIDVEVAVSAERAKRGGHAN